MAISPPTLIGSNSDFNAGAPATLIATLTAGAAPGDLIVVCCGGNRSSTVAIVDSKTNTWSNASNTATGTTTQFSIHYAVVTARMASGDTITGTWSVGNPDRFIYVYLVSGADIENPFDKTARVSSVGSLSWDSGNTAITDSTYELVIGGSTDNATSQTSTPGASLTELDDVTTSDGVNFSTVYRLTVVPGAYKANGTWSGGATTGVTAAVATFRQSRLGGTTTSTSSTSSTSSSTSSTSSSTSSTSTSASTTSVSTSSTSSSTSTSSTSSSISSTSSSISSTSTSSTSSSTSISSTSSSISSTSTSSTSVSTTSQSTSISSTSTSFSSTSSSVSSTSRSTSSTSFSSTSSSSSTSTTAIPLNLDYTYQDSLTLPVTGVDDINPDTVKNYQNVSVDDGDYFIQYGSENMVQEFKKKWTNNTDTPTLLYKGRSTQSTLTSPMLIQIYNVNSTTWETLARVNTIPADTDFQIRVSQSTNVSNYYDSNNIVTFRSYQLVV